MLSIDGCGSYLSDVYSLIIKKEMLYILYLEILVYIDEMWRVIWKSRRLLRNEMVDDVMIFFWNEERFSNCDEIFYFLFNWGRMWVKVGKLREEVVIDNKKRYIDWIYSIRCLYLILVIIRRSLVVLSGIVM